MIMKLCKRGKGIIYFIFFNVDTFSRNILLIKIDSQVQSFITFEIVKRFNYQKMNQYNPNKEQMFHLSCSDKLRFH